jgi:hypothetical protein
VARVADEREIRRAKRGAFRVFYLLSLVALLAFGKSDHFADGAVAFTVVLSSLPPPRAEPARRSLTASSESC